MEEDVYTFDWKKGSLRQIEAENEKCLSENRALRSKLHHVKENSSLRVANILAEVLIWIDQSTRGEPGTSGVENVHQEESDMSTTFVNSLESAEHTPIYKTQGQKGVLSRDSTADNSRGITLPGKSLFRGYNTNTKAFQRVTSEAYTTKSKDSKNRNSYSPTFSGNQSDVTPELTDTTNVSDSPEDDTQIGMKSLQRERRGSIIYDTGEIKLNVQQSEGFRPIQEKSDLPNKERATTPEVKDRSHGHVWTKSGSSPLHVLSSTPNKTQPASFESNNSRRISSIPVRSSKESARQRKTPSPSSLSKKEEKSLTTSRARSPRASPVNTDEDDTSVIKFANFSSNASSNRSDRGRSVTPSSRKNRSPYPSFNDTYLSDADTSGFLSNGPDVSVNGVKVAPTTKLLGEIAFQLDRKILNYVFRNKSKKRRFYGYIIRNIPEKIRRDSIIDESTGLVDVQKKHVLEYRYQYILNTLKPLGYRIHYHPDFCTDMVNKYGLLPLPPERSTSSGITWDQKELIQETLQRITPSHELQDITIILNCLALLAKDEDEAIISF